MRLFLGLITLFALLGCSKEDPKPELRDTVLKRLDDQLSQSKSSYDSELKKIEEAEKALAKADLYTQERSIALRELQAARRNAARLKQDYEYLQIKVERRKAEARRDYRIAFHEGQEWPPKGELEAFEANQRLRGASRNWNTRVPKLNDRILAAWPKPDPKAKASAQKPEAKKSDK